MEPTDPQTVRLASISDVHFTAKPLGWKRRDLLSKRIAGWMNVAMLGRGFRFRHAPAIAPILVRELKERRFDHLVFSGDATTLAFESEFAAAVRLSRRRRSRSPARSRGSRQPRLLHQGTGSRAIV